MTVVDPYSVPNINEVIRDKIIACGAVPLVTDMLAVNAYPVLFRQLLDLLCCGECAGGGLYYYMAIAPGGVGITDVCSWGPNPLGTGAFNANAFNDAIPALKVDSANGEFQLQVPTPPGPTVVFNIPAAASAANGGWIDSVAFIPTGGNGYSLEVATNGEGIANPTTIPFIITGPISLVGYIQLLPEIVEPEV